MSRTRSKKTSARSRSRPQRKPPLQSRAAPHGTDSLPVPLLSQRWLDAGLAASVALLALIVLYCSVTAVAELGPFPDAEEYALTATSLAHFGSYTISILHTHYPPRYPFGFPVLLVPAYWLPGATLANGIYAVATFGVITAVCTYISAYMVCGRLAGVLSASVLLLLPQFQLWNHELMSETATMALVAVSLPLLYVTVSTTDSRRHVKFLGVLGAISGITMLVRLNNFLLPVALLVALLVADRAAFKRRQDVFAFVAGPSCAILILGVYARITFGSVLDTGYKYWIPSWYASLGTTFSPTYAFSSHGVPHDPGATQSMPNTVYLARALVGLLPSRSLCFATTSTFLLVLIGGFVLVRTESRVARAFSAFAVTLTILTYGLFSLYFYESVRFLAFIAPVIAVCAGVGGQAGITRMIMGVRRSQPRSLVVGISVSIIMSISIITGIGPTLQGSYLYQAVRGTTLEFGGFANVGATMAYRAAALPRGSLVVTDVTAPLLDHAGISDGKRIVPATRGEYWQSPPFQHVPTVEQQLGRIRQAVQRGVPVWTDSLSIDNLRRNATVDPGASLTLKSFRFQPAYSQGSFTIYRILQKSAG